MESAGPSGELVFVRRELYVVLAISRLPPGVE